MPSFTYKCPNCGNALKYTPDIGKFSCEFCGSTFEEAYLSKLDDQAYDQLKEADKDGEYGKAEDGAQLVYSCPSCGAELVTGKTTAATMCYYCHSPVVLTGRLAAGLRPDTLLPFKYDKEKAKEKFFAWIRKKKYVPKSFISESSVENLSGVYYPYWLADYETTGHFSGEGRIVTHSSTPTHNITTTKIYQVTRDADITFINVQRSALVKADRKLSDGIQPYRLEETKSFEPAYLSGFLAEKRDVEKEEVAGSIETELQGYVQPLLTAGSPYTSLTGASRMEVNKNTFRYALLPAWILTYRGQGGKTYYYAMNGQTEETCGILPVNAKKLLLHAGILAAGVAGVLLGVFYFFVSGV